MHGWALIRTARRTLQRTAQPQASATAVWAAGGRAAGRRQRDAAGGGHGVRHDPRQQCADRRHLPGPPTRRQHIHATSTGSLRHAPQRAHARAAGAGHARTDPPLALTERTCTHSCRQRRGLRRRLRSGSAARAGRTPTRRSDTSFRHAARRRCSSARRSRPPSGCAPSGHVCTGTGLAPSTRRTAAGGTTLWCAICNERRPLVGGAWRFARRSSRSSTSRTRPSTSCTARRRSSTSTAAYASAQGRRSVATSAQDSATSAQDSATSAQDSASSAIAREDAGGAEAAGRRRAELMVEQRVRMRSLLLERLFDAMREMVPEESTLRALVAVLITLMAEPSEITGRSLRRNDVA
jgi:hypothetical protein